MSKSKSKSDSKSLIGSLKSLVLRQSSSTNDKMKNSSARASPEGSRLVKSPAKNATEAPNNTAVYDPTSTKGKKAPRFLLTGKGETEANKNNHHVQLSEKTDVKQQQHAASTPTEKGQKQRPRMSDVFLDAFQTNVDTLSETSSDFPNQNESSCYESGVSDSEGMYLNEKLFPCFCSSTSLCPWLQSGFHYDRLCNSSVVRKYRLVCRHDVQHYCSSS